MPSQGNSKINNRCSPGTVLRAAMDPQIFDYPGPGYSEREEDGMLIQCDVAVEMRDGVTIYIDLYRPAQTSEPLPVLIAWSPYGKHGGVKIEHIPGHDINPAHISKHYHFEAADPAYWCPQGYAVIFVDPRGSWNSEGDFSIFSSAEAEDCYDLIEWAGTQNWSNSKVGMIGQSYFGIIQWNVAALNPPHLTCIAPWGAVSDVQRDLGRHGGIPNDQMLRVMNRLTGLSTKFSDHAKVDDWLESMLEHPFDDAYWQDKRPDLAKITVPTYAVADWSDMLLHTPGTMDGFNKISSDRKWLEINGRKKWERFVQPEHADRLRMFYDRFLKGVENEVDDWPPVRLEVRERYKVGTMYDEQEWPLARTDYKKLYLHSQGTASFEPAQQDSMTYDATEGQLVFNFPVTEPLELTGFMKLRLWVEADGSDDMDLFAGVRKIDSDGNEVHFPFYTVYGNGEATLGCLRVSHRAADPERSTDWRPFLTHESEARLAPGEIVPVDIPMMPSSTLFEKGDTLQIIIQGRDIVVNDENMPCAGHTFLRNKGKHIVYLGGKYESHLLAPFVGSRG